MRSRGLVVAVAFMLAMSATFVVYLYVRGVEKKTSSGEMVSVVVSDQDIPAGTKLDDLIEGGHFDSLQVPQDAVVRGAVTQLSQLNGRETSAPVLQGEQISTTRLRGSEQLPGGMLGIPDDMQAVTLPLEAPRLAGGAIQQGDHVTIYGTFQNVASTQKSVPAATATLVPDVEVLKVSTATQPNTADTSSQITLALKPLDAEKVVFAQEQGSVWMALLPPNSKGQKSRPVTAIQLVN
jgi:pilus assembly protein CpaB